MRKVSDELISLIKKQIEEHGIVVWYDPEEHYKQLVEKMSLSDTTILKYEGSFFELRFKAEPFLEFVDEEGNIPEIPDLPPKLLIYVPLKREDTEGALAEIEAYGVVMEPGASAWQRNTRLKTIAERVFKKIAPQEAKSIVAKVDQGILTLEDLDRLAERDHEFGTLKLIFDTSNPQEIILRFLCSQDFDTKILEKQSLPELGALVRNEFGFDLEHDVSIENFKESLARSLLLAEFILKIKAYHSVPEALTSVPIPESQEQQKSVLEICKLWRNRFDLRESYADYAGKIEKKVPFESLDIPPEALCEIETFAFTEKVLINFAAEQIVKGNLQVAEKIVRKRKNSFWASLYPGEFGLQWQLLESALLLITKARAIRKELPHTEKTLSAFLEAYTSGTQTSGPWYELERYHRTLEYRYAHLDTSLGDSLHEKVIFVARREYIETASLCADALIEVVKKSSKGSENRAILKQREVFRRKLYPLLSEGKTAYILVDALRYEMGLELAEGLKDDFEVRVEAALSELPTITQVGMAALMPGAENGLRIVDIGRGRIGVQIGNATLKDRKSRLKYLTSNINIEGSISVLKLDELVRFRKQKSEELEEARLIVVTSQEIDRRGEETSDEREARIYMEDVLSKLKRGIRTLANLGVCHFLITADHGFIFLDEINESMKVDPPGGETVELHPRVWMGRGGTTSHACQRFKAKELNIEGCLEFAFPKGLACFRMRGKESSFFHGGISLPEMIIPVIRLTYSQTDTLPASKTAYIEIEFPQKKITNRFFTINLTYTPASLFGTDKQRVRVLLKHGRTIVGKAVASLYGFEEGSQEITLEKGQKNTVTLLLEQDVDKASIHVIDASTEIELAAMKDVKVDLII